MEMVRDLGQWRGLASRPRNMLQEIYRILLIWNFFEVRRFQLWMRAIHEAGTLRQRAVVRVYSCNACFVWSLLRLWMPATLLGLFFKYWELFLFLEIETWNIWWWLGLVFVWGKGGYRGVRRCHDTSRKNKVRRKRDVVVIGGQGLDFPADLHAPWLPPYGPFFFYPEICPCLQPAGILTLEHQIMSDTGNERTGLWATVTKGFQQTLSCRKYTARVPVQYCLVQFPYAIAICS